ncbi:MAG: 8-oxo-dGTP diphosphatase [Halioglobus sp.]|jgi:8-oxo-dGTP diphosphatase
MAAVHVAVGVILNKNQQVLIARRPMGSHQGGLWEFPGGKVETGESLEQALFRELKEELAIEVSECSALVTIEHDYGDKLVLLDVCLVREFTGDAVGMEGQVLQWIGLDQLREFEFPAANKPIVELLTALPEDGPLSS